MRTFSSESSLRPRSGEVRRRARVALAAAVLAPGAALAQREHGAVLTDRDSAVALALPREDDAFAFVVYGDRTGGPAEGIAVLAQAVRDTNQLDPDLVMTVGDLVQGYNERAPWLEQMREFRGVMGDLRMPWFPVAGNHDVYWRGADRPPEEHEGDYEEHFGPLWYAFEHKRCWFLVLYSDEPDPETGERDYRKAASQRMSARQTAWLQGALERARGARHVFVFLHHPRWQEGQYGDDWQRVHRLLAEAGNVTAVFAGHIHRMRFDGVVDGIRYYTLATVGGALSADLPAAGYVHQLHVVSVRERGVEVAALPVGAVMDPEKITGVVSDDVRRLDGELRPAVAGRAVLDANGACDASFEVTVRNPTRRPIEVTLEPRSADRYWSFLPDHAHPVVGAGEEARVTFRARRIPAAPDANLEVPALHVAADYLSEGLRFPVSPRAVPLGVEAPDLEWSGGGPDRAVDLRGDGACLRIESARVGLGDGPFTVEGRLFARDLSGRRALVAKTQGSEFGLFVSDGKPWFGVHLEGAYLSAEAEAPVLTEGAWHHVAGVYDGEEVRVYVDGVRVARAVRATPRGDGARTPNDHPLLVGADPDERGAATSSFDGWVDDVRLVPRALYAGERFEPSTVRDAAASDACLDLRMDEVRGPWVIDASARRCHATLVGGARVGAPWVR